MMYTFDSILSRYASCCANIEVASIANKSNHYNNTMSRKFNTMNNDRPSEIRSSRRGGQIFAVSTWIGSRCCRNVIKFFFRAAFQGSERSYYILSKNSNRETLIEDKQKRYMHNRYRHMYGIYLFKIVYHLYFYHVIYVVVPLWQANVPRGVHDCAGRSSDGQKSIELRHAKKKKLARWKQWTYKYIVNLSASTSSIPTVLFIQHTIIIMPGFLKIVNVKKQNKTAMSGKSQKQVKATRNYSSTMPAKTLYSALI